MIHNDKLYVSAMNGTFVMDLDTDRFQWICRNAQSFTIDREENLWILIGTSLYKMELAHPDNQKHYALPRYGIQFEPKRIMTTRAGISISWFWEVACIGMTNRPILLSIIRKKADIY